MRVLALIFFFCCFACQSTDSNDSKPTPTLLSEDEMLAPAHSAGSVTTTAPPSALLTPFQLTDSIALVPDDAASPRAYYEISSLEATSANTKLNTTINTALGRTIAGDEAPMRVTDLRRTIQAFVKTRIKAYGQQEVEPAELNDMPSAYEQDHRFSTAIAHQDERTLTLATNHYYFTGGAHGNYYTVLQIFDLKEAKEVHFNDLFLPGSKDQLTKALGQLSAFQSEDIYPTENVGLTAEGFVFNFPPYEIGSYADGEIEILLPYDDAKDYLSDNARSLLGI